MDKRNEAESTKAVEEVAPAPQAPAVKAQGGDPLNHDREDEK